MTRLVEGIIRLDHEVAGDGILEAETAFIDCGRHQVGVDGANEELADLGRIVNIDRRQEVSRETILQEEWWRRRWLRILLRVYKKRRIQRQLAFASITIRILEVNACSAAHDQPRSNAKG